MAEKQDVKSMLLGFLTGGAGGISAEVTGAVRKQMEHLFDGDGGFIGWWQRKPGEPAFSANNVVKAASVLGGYALYRHIDPLPDSAVDNIAVLGLSAYLLGLLVVPQSTEAGAHFQDFEGKVFIGLKALNVDVEKRDAVMRWVRNLSHRQERRLAALLMGRGFEVKDVIGLLTDDSARQLLTEVLGEEQEPINLRDAVERVWNEISAVWAVARPHLEAADQTVAGVINNFNRWLASKGVRQ